MPLNHFKARHFGAQSLITLGSLGGLLEVILDYVVKFRRRMGR
jgi:hypothetical protein